MRTHVHIQVVVVSDQKPVLYACRLLLAIEMNTRLVGEATDETKGRALLRQWRPEVLVLDLNLSQAGGATLLRRMRQAGADSHIVALGAEADMPCVPAYLPREVVSYLPYQEMFAGLPRVLESVARRLSRSDGHTETAGPALAVPGAARSRNGHDPDGAVLI